MLFDRHSHRLNFFFKNQGYPSLPQNPDISRTNYKKIESFIMILIK